MNKQVNAFQEVKRVGIVPAIRTSNPDEALRAADAVFEGGIPVLEVSLAHAEALKVLDAVVKKRAGSMLIGAGTVVDANGVSQAAALGARFIVTPGFSAEAVEKAKELGLAVFGGAMTPTEVQVASASQVDAVKLFPCFATGDARYLKALRGQYPHTEFIASGGIGLDNCEAYIRAGACAIGVGGEIVDFDAISTSSYSIFTVRARRLSKAVRAARALLDHDSKLADDGR